MHVYRLFSDDTEILGAVLNDFSSAADSEGFYHIFEKYGLTDKIDPDKWYPGDVWVKALNEIASQPGAMSHFVGIGMHQMEAVVFPPEMENMTLQEILYSLDEMNHLSLRGTDIGTITTEQIAPQHFKLTLHTFEPDDLWYGIIYALVRRFKPDDSGPFILEYDPDATRRDHGGEVTVLHLKWE